MGWMIATSAIILSCGDDESTKSDGSGGTTNTGGGFNVTGGAANTGGTNTGGVSATGGSTPTGGTTSAAGGAGTGLPLGALCANDGNCAQSPDGLVICCKQSCTLADRCEGSSSFLPCNSEADCEQYGGGKVCCRVYAGGAPMQFCTKPSACQNGEILP
jgi:hypothetical protein